MELYLVRHGHTEVSEAGKIAGSGDVSLSTKGRDQLLQLKDDVLKLNAESYYASTLHRAVQSVELIGGTDVVEDARLCELDFGEWEGLTWEQVHQQFPDELASWSQDWVERSPPGGETFSRLAERCDDWLRELFSIEREVVVVGAHGGSIRALLCSALELPLSSAMQFSIDHTSVTKLILNPSGNRCAYVNHCLGSDRGNRL